MSRPSSGPAVPPTQLVFETLISDVSAKLVMTSDDAMQTTVEWALARIGRFFGVDRCGLLSVDSGRLGVSLAYSWYEESLEASERVPASFDLAEHLPWSAHRLVEQRQPLELNSLDDLPPEASQDRASFAVMGIRSALSIPIVVGQAVPYIMSLDTIRRETHWQPAYVPRLRLLGETIANAVERKRASDALRESENRLELAMQSAHAGVWDLDTASGRIWGTKEAKEIYGFPVDADITLDAFLKAVHPEDVERVRDRLTRTMEAEGNFVDEYRVVLPAGQVRWVSARGRVRTGPGPSRRRMLGISFDVTERKQAEARLREHETRLQVALDVAGLGFYLTSLVGDVTFLEERTRDLLGIPREEEARTRTFWLAHIHPGDRESTIEASRAIREGVVGHVWATYRYQHPSRGLRWYSHSSRAFERDAAGAITKIAGVIQDVTELKSAEQAVRDNEARLASAIDVASLGFYEVADGDLVTYLDRRCRALFGFPEDQAEGRSLTEFWFAHIHPDDYPRLLNFHEQLNDGRMDRVPVVYRYVHPERGLTWLEQVTHVIVRHTSGLARNTLGVVRDITEDKLRETALRESEEVNRATFEQAAVGMAHVGTSGEFLRVNERLCEMLGYTRDELTGMPFQQVTHPDDLPKDLEQARQVLAGDIATYSMEKRYIRRDGGVLWAQLTVSLLRDGDGRPKHFIAVVDDISDRKRGEEALTRALADNERLREQLEHENIYLREEVTTRGVFERLVGQSPAIRKALQNIERVATTQSTVLLLGETGTGKELFAEAIHRLSPRSGRTMVRVNCAAIPVTLIENELFGRERGAYTGALSKQIGRFELANGSTIFLDEIGELPMDIQVKLLRVLQERQIERLGSPRPVPVDVRIIAASNRDLERDVREGRFREDLFYRINVFPVHVPPLRERLEDIPLLVEALVNELSGVMGKRITSVSRGSMDALLHYRWPGNIRELRNAVERAMILATGPVLEVVPPGVSRPASASPGPATDRLDRETVLRALEATGWRVRGAKGAAALLGLKPTTLESRMAKLGIKRP